jgi:ribosomal protein S14
LLKKKFLRFKKEGIKKKEHIKKETERLLLRTILGSNSIRASKKILAYAKKTKKRNKKRSISYQTTLCMETGHYKSRINWGKLSRYSFKSTANKDSFSHLVKKTK